MSLFAKPGMTAADAKVVMQGFQAMAEAVAERLRGHDAEIAELREAIAELKELREDCAQLVEAMGMQGYGTLAIAAAIRKGGKA